VPDGCRLKFSATGCHLPKSESYPTPDSKVDSEITAIEPDRTKAIIILESITRHDMQMENSEHQLNLADKQGL
jgi:hypothetical protein